jgi:putative DNA primase/helicase
MNLRSIAKALGGEVSGHQVLAPGPHHSKHDRSLVVFLDPSAPDLFRVHSHAGDDWKSCRDHVKARLGIDSQPDLRNIRAAVAPTVQPEAVEDGTRVARALAIWADACPGISSTPAMGYMVNRGIDPAKLPADLGLSLRWHPSCPWEQGKHGCMLGLMTDAVTGEPKAIHRTAITSAGRKVDKKMLGPSAGCVVRLWPDDAVSTALVLGEGIETTLAAATRIDYRNTHLIPAWAACSAGSMAKFPVLSGIECLTLLVDNDKSGAGQRAAAECSDRWTSADREVIRLIPDIQGQDFNDIVRSAA